MKDVPVRIQLTEGAKILCDAFRNNYSNWTLGIHMIRCPKWIKYTCDNSKANLKESLLFIGPTENSSLDPVYHVRLSPEPFKPIMVSHPFILVVTEILVDPFPVVANKLESTAFRSRGHPCIARQPKLELITPQRSPAPFSPSGKLLNEIRRFQRVVGGIFSAPRVSKKLTIIAVTSRFSIIIDTRRRYNAEPCCHNSNC